ncbi:MAG: MBL fold metallo-hydrolase [Archangium sp.]|nr:MBL fold metallo-hydrolase [Archangium sp.]
MNKLIVSMLLTGCTALPAAAPHPFVPLPAPSAKLEVCWIDTGGVSVPGGYGAGGATIAEQWEVTAAAILIRHPKGDLLLDTGISPTAAEEHRELGGWARFVFSQTAGRNLPRRRLSEALAALGATSPLAVLLSHAHADHAGGLTDLPAVPVWLAAEERALVESELEQPRGVVLPAHARAMAERLVSLSFEPVPFANYDSSYDVFGDGSVVVVPTFGHTPGSVATFVNGAGGQRFVHVGDLINLQESLSRGVGKSWLMRKFTDEDDAATQAQVAKLVQLQATEPGLVILPAHDRPAFVRLFGEDNGRLPPCR